MYVVDPHLYHGAVVGEDAGELKARVSDAIAWHQHFRSSNAAWCVSEGCMNALFQHNLDPTVHVLRSAFAQLGIVDINALDVYQCLVVFLQGSNYVERACSSNHGSGALECVVPDTVLSRLPGGLRSAFRACLALLACGAVVDQGHPEPPTLASTACSCDTIQLRVEASEPYWLPWEAPPRHERTLDEIASDLGDFRGVIQEVYELLIPPSERTRYRLLRYAVMPQFVRSINATRTDRDRVLRNRVVRRTTLFLCGKGHYDAHVMHGRVRADGSELWQFYLNLGRTGWRLQYYKNQDGSIDLYRIAAHDDAER